EVYDFLRLLFARAGVAYSYLSGNKMKSYTEQEIIDTINSQFTLQRMIILAPLIKGRKGHYREVFDQYRKRGFTKVWVDGEMMDLEPGMQLDRYKIHDIDLIVDRISPEDAGSLRVVDSVRAALKLGKGVVTILNPDTKELTHFSKHLMDVETGLSYNEPQPNLFSFNSPYGACPSCDGLGTSSDILQEDLIPNPKLSINKGGLAPLGDIKDNWTFTQLRAMSKKLKFSMSKPIGDIDKSVLDVILNGTDEKFEVQYKGSSGGSQTYETKWKGIIPSLMEAYHEKSFGTLSRWADEFMTVIPCPSCDGGRLNKEALSYRIGEVNIASLSNKSIGELDEWLKTVEDDMSDRQLVIGKEVLKEIRERVKFLVDVGLSYLALNNSAKTLSGGEAQRIRLATQIGSQLEEVLYILDEPSIGLHQRDNHRLINSLKELRDIGNSVIVVEHDRDMIVESDYVVDIGPRAGKNGGDIVAHGPWTDIKDNGTVTSDYLGGQRKIEVPAKRRKGSGKKLTLKGCSGHNLKNVTVDFPLGKFIAVTGVSGSGKSSLINETLHPVLSEYVYNSKKKPLPFKGVKGLEHIDKVITIDQSPIGRTPRSNPATYVGFFSDIRNLYAEIGESKIRGYKPGRFSFNVKGGRCETCRGGGQKVIEMNFLSDVLVECETCQGKRYNRETLEIRYKNKSISDVLNMTVEEAVSFFEPIPSIYRKIKALNDVGLGYITLGQSSTTISGGEAQRVKLASELGKIGTGQTFYILDEPTTGLHFEDIKVLLEVLQNLVDLGNTVLVIEHNLDVVKVADHIIDIGPEGGNGGGQVMITGTPEEVVKSGVGHTSKFLAVEM
ncbi:MAG: excinuclease ABC subunit UvrA, partial [Bacteroidia bacterium]